VNSEAFEYSMSNARRNLDPSAIAAWAQSAVGPYFNETSSGRYRPVFTGMGHIPMDLTDGAFDCQDRAATATGAPFTNVVAFDNTDGGGFQGFGSPGEIDADPPTSPDLLLRPPSTTGRGIYMPGFEAGSTTFASGLAHEIGHTLHWPHSFIGPDGQYDSYTDLMSGIHPDACKPVSPSGLSCPPQNTLAFNRYAAGWIDDSQVALHQSGPTTATIDVAGSAGIQMIVAPNQGDGRAMLTLEARSPVNADSWLPPEGQGVAAYIIDQRPNACVSGPDFGACTSTDRRQAQAIGQPRTFDNILQVGSTTVINGLTVTVLARSGGTFTVQVSGNFVAPARS